MTRRTLIGTAVAGGAGVAAMRLFAAGRLPDTNSGPTDWISPLHLESARVVQLLRRATFGAGPAELDRALGDGFQKTLDRLLETPAAPPPPLPGADLPGFFDHLTLAQLQTWWLGHMLATPTPFAERMTLFGHGHFTSDHVKVSLRNPHLYWQNLTWRANALGDFRQFLGQVTVDPAMLRYLDLGYSTGSSPNENYARELMELFTMGAGNFSEDDVRAGAKALAGWTIPTTGPGSPRTGVFMPRRAYREGPVTFLGKTARFDTEGVLAEILANPATAPFVVRRLLFNFALPQPSSATVSRLAAGFVRSGWSLRHLMRDVFTSDEFSAASSYRSLVKQPVEFMLHALRALGISDARPAIDLGAGMGQALFNPPDVSGWPLNEGWISSSTILARVNFAGSLLAGVSGVPSAGKAHLDHLDGVLSPATAALLNQATSDLERWTIVLASPEFQLK
jgi:uncharacterized protein (DUF1800 family)